MVIAHHLVWTAYGCWLPNDPRGSMSHDVASAVIAELGEHHYGRRRVQPASRSIREFYSRANEVLKFPRLTFGPDDFGAVAESLRAGIQQHGYTCYACAVMPDHVHLLIRKHRDTAEAMIAKLQQSSRECLVTMGLRTPEHPVWTLGGCKRFLNTPDDVRRVIGYIERNPGEIGLPRQEWGFVVEYDGWPLRRSRKEC